MTLSLIRLVCEIITFGCVIGLSSLNRRLIKELEDKQEEINYFKSNHRTIHCFVPKKLYEINARGITKQQREEAKEKIIATLFENKNELKKAISFVDCGTYEIAGFTFVQGGINER